MHADRNNVNYVAIYVVGRSEDRAAAVKRLPAGAGGPLYLADPRVSRGMVIGASVDQDYAETRWPVVVKAQTNVSRWALMGYLRGLLSELEGGLDVAAEHDRALSTLTDEELEAKAAQLEREALDTESHARELEEFKECRRRNETDSRAIERT
jgi:hypothetical protein